MKKIVHGILIGLVLALVPMVVLAAVSDITSMTGSPTNTSITLTWVKPSSANTTVVRYRTDAYPANITDGTLAYNSTGYQFTISSLTAGQAYYFAAWGQNGSDYSPNSYNLTVSTLAVSLATGAGTTNNITVPQGTLNASMTQAPNITGFKLQPFDGIITHFTSSSGGLGMPIANLWETLALIGIVASGVATYTKTRTFFAGWGIAFLLTIAAVSFELTQGWLIAVEIAIGLGVWAVDHANQ